MQGAPCQSLKLGEAIEKVTVRISRIASDIMQLLHIPRAYTEREHGRARVLQQVGRGTRVTSIAKAVGYQEYHLTRRFTTLLEDRLTNRKNGRLDVIYRALICFRLPLIQPFV